MTEMKRVLAYHQADSVDEIKMTDDQATIVRVLETCNELDVSRVPFLAGLADVRKHQGLGAKKSWTP